MDSEEPTTMEKLPLEIVEHILKFLDAHDRMNCVLVCRKFLFALVRSLPLPKTIRLLYSGCPCHAETNSILLEDELIKNQITDSDAHKILSQCVAAPLTSLTLSNCDFQKVRPWTLALIAQLNKLQRVEFDSCRFSISESMLIRSIFAASFATLTTVEMKQCLLITDKLARSISRNCPKLETFSVSGCKSVSTFSVLAMIETALYREKPMLTVHVEDTMFCAQQLADYMSSPLFCSKNDWSLVPTHIVLGYEKPAVIAEHRAARCVLIYV
ncbi:hypothetical protein WR25_21441 [Diploscapter pachys]|uniref:F-box domain-containing protein n=1 Tax=Diploscapter pachys TaxID=2018661 RepID=A0A2A2K0I4_9BILA|nr:hypothetical protein WR25_21441 [Diploscapter pachys]